METHKKLILVITGSARPENFTMKAALVLVDELKKIPSLTYELIDAAKLQLPLPGTQYKNSSHEMLQEKVKNATGIILVSPEYHGGISSVMKLIIDHLGFPSTLAGKPIALLGVAAGSIGAIKSLEQLRSICSHVGAIVLPRPISIANVQEVFDAKGNCPKETRQLIQSVGIMLVDYIDKHILPLIAFENLIRKEKKGI